MIQDKITQNTSHSDAAFKEASEILVGGVNSPVRACKNVHASPRFIRRGQGAYLWDEDGNRYIDYVLSYGPAILGHAQASVVADLHNAIIKGNGFGSPTQAETQLAKQIRDFFPSCEKVRFVNSGTEATMSAIRLARGVTGRDRIVKCHGHYHGHVDSLLVKAGSGALTHGAPDSAGIPNAVAELTSVVDYNDLDAMSAVFQSDGAEIAAVILEPVAGNMGMVLPDPGYLEGVAKLCKENGALLIFDEVMTGLRVGLNGAQGIYGVKPDITCLGKVIGGGLPAAAYGGSAEIMDHLSPVGPVYQAGTLSGNPVAMAAGLKTLELISEPGFYDGIFAQTEKLVVGLRERAKAAGIPFTTNHVGSMFGGFFTEETAITNYQQVMACDNERFNRFFHGMLEAGVYLAPASFEAGFMSAAHCDEDIQFTLDAAEKVFAGLK